MTIRFLPVIALLLLLNRTSSAQNATRNWNGKKSAVVLTYDDALNVHLDKVIPALDSLNLKGTFYLIAASNVVSNRMDEWRKAAKTGHELGNHSLNHPCDGNLPGRSFVTDEGDLSKYSVERAVKEIRIANTLLKAIDGKDRRTYAYPCGDLKIGDSLYYSSLKNDFSGARGVTSRYTQIKEVDLSNIDAFFEANTTGEKMIQQVKEAENTGSLIVFLFHGIGGEHNLNVDFEEHKKLINYLKRNEKNIWIAPMVEVAEFIRKQQSR
ncbi:polysaccharide deacetylase family protein [Desertivirga brevis]|uniref:polysaccharide deacetylase family protein n=1 Tax=Desertivirga brevis TaxID=2810310 RepID=UPI001A97C713|nr:polysaccharide deacetylase family protein [Pedobacter sp. SYSU D00873]